MSSRALRKAQREREEQERLNNLEAENDDMDEEERQHVASSKQSAFALLAAADEAEEDVVQDPEAEELGDDDDTQTPPATSEPNVTAGKKKKKKKKRKGKDNNLAATDEIPTTDDDLDEIDKALKELSTNGNASTPATTVSGINTETVELCKLLAIDSSHLHAQNEMRRLFGRTALEDREDDAPPEAGNVGGNRRQQRQMQRVGLAAALRGQQGGGRPGALSQMAMKRNIFVQGKEEWPNATSGGLGMEVEEKRADGTVLYRFVHNRAYQDVQTQFEIAVESMDPNRLVVMLQQNPYHISTLLQVSEIAKQDRENAMAGDLLERALFSFGRAVHSTFAKNLAEGKARLDFRRPENREFWLAGWRYMQNLTMRATWRTVYEWAKLLLSLSPEDDPYGMLLVLDQYAIRSRQDLDYLNLARNSSYKTKLQDAPGSQLSQALAEYRAGNRSKGQQALYSAVGRYPWVIARLLHENNAAQIPPAIWGKEPRREREKLHSELYATRAKDLWNTPEASALLLETASALPPDTPSVDIDDSDITTNEARHVLLSDTPALIALIPKSYTAQLSSSSDPLPPPDSYPSSTPGRSSESTIEAIDAEISRLTQFLSSVFSARDFDSMSEADIQRAIEDASPQRGARIVDAARRIEMLRTRRERLEVGSMREIMDRLGQFDDATLQRELDARRAGVVDGEVDEG